MKKQKTANTLDFLESMDMPTSQIVSLPTDLIRPDPDQPRTSFQTVDGLVDDATQGELENLADDIAENGLIQPISVREADDGGYYLVAGERRWRAVCLNQERGVPGSDTIGSIIRNDLSGEKLRMVQLAENLQRSDLSDLQTAAYLKRLLNEYPHLQKQQLGKIMKKNSQFVSRILAMLDPKWAHVVDSGRITYASLLEQFRALPEEQRAEVFAKAQAEDRQITSGDIKKAREASKRKAGEGNGDGSGNGEPTWPFNGQETGSKDKGLSSDVMSAVSSFTASDARQGENYQFNPTKPLPAERTRTIIDHGGDAHIPAGAGALNPSLLEKRELKITLGQLAKLVTNVTLRNTNHMFSAMLPVDEMRSLLTDLGGNVPDDDGQLPMALAQRLNEI